MVSFPVSRLNNVCVLIFLGVFVFVLDVFNLLVADESIVLSPHKLVRKGQIEKTGRVAEGVLAIHFLKSDLNVLVFEFHYFPFFLNLLANDNLGWVVHDDFLVIKSEPCGLSLLELFRFLNRFQSDQVLLGESLRQLFKLLKQ